MYFNFRSYFRLAYLASFKWRESSVPFSVKRLLFLLAFFVIFPMFQLFNAICFLLDDILFPRYRRVEVREPVFVIGNPRSGTTLIHRVMARDTQNFFCFRTWEILFPSILQKSALSMLGKLDRLLGGLGRRAIEGIESRKFRHFNRMHGIGTFLPEEDDKLFLHILVSLDLVWVFPFFEFGKLGRFDAELGPEERERAMRFYVACVKRQAYFRGRSRRLLSKSPAFSAKVRSLMEHFHDCKFIYMVRHPLDVVPSMTNMSREIWRSTIGWEPSNALQDEVYETLKFLYDYPLAQLEQAPADRYEIVKYDDLTQAPERTINSIYEHFGFATSEHFHSALREEDESARTYKSKHEYALEDCNIPREQILSDLKHVLERFRFETGGTNAMAEKGSSKAASASD